MLALFTIDRQIPENEYVPKISLLKFSNICLTCSKIAVFIIATATPLSFLLASFDIMSRHTSSGEEEEEESRNPLS